MTHTQTESLMKISSEEAYTEAQNLEDSSIEQLDGVTVYTGRHPIHGSIHIVIPAAGEGLLLLPIVIRAF